MKLYEYDAKGIFLRYGIPIPEGKIISEAEDAQDVATKLGNVMIKAQVLVGGRGKAGGILTATPEDAVYKAEKLLGMSIKGIPVRKVLVEEDKKPEKEMYIGITFDRKARRPIIMATTEGGMDIEDTAMRSPEKILRIHINPLTGLHEYQSRRLAFFLDRANSTKIADIVKKLYLIFTDFDCTLVEINPLAKTSQGIFALDAKIIIDDYASSMHEFKEEEMDTLSGLAKKSGMSFVGLDGNIGCIVNGAGLAMATLDLIKQYGGEPANFMDVRAGANEEQIKTALHIVSSNSKVRVIIINIFGGLTKCTEVARGIIDVKSNNLVPLVVRLAGTNEEEGRKILEKAGIILVTSTDEAAMEAVKLGYTN